MFSVRGQLRRCLNGICRKDLLETEGFLRTIHSGGQALQPIGGKNPNLVSTASEEERKLLEKLGDPTKDDETRGYLNELYRDFDVIPEKTRSSKTQKKPRPTDETPKRASGAPLLSGSVFRATVNSLPASPSRHFLHQQRYMSSSSNDDSKKLSESFKLSGKKSFSTDDVEVIWDSSEEEAIRKHGVEIFPEQEKLRLDTSELESRHGETGVFDVEELVELLRDEKLKDIAVIEVPSSVAYADYLVICTTISARQSKAVCAFFKKLYKRRRRSNDPALKIEGEDCKEWKVLDMSNVVVHVFDEETRNKYDIETLWTVGSSFDELTQNKIQQAEHEDVLEQCMMLVRSLQPKSSEKQQI